MRFASAGTAAYVITAPFLVLYVSSLFVAAPAEYGVLPAVAAPLLLCSGILILLGPGSEFPTLRRVAGQTTGFCILFVGAWILWMRNGVVSPTTDTTRLFLVVAVGALVEEVIFRHILFCRLFHAFRQVRSPWPAAFLGAAVLSQGCFAVMHTVPWSLSAIPLERALWLLPGGLLLLVVRLRLGLGVAAGLHAYVNIEIASRPWGTGASISFVSTVIATMVAISCLWAIRPDRRAACPHFIN